ncbi:Sister chromatid cohesion protein 2 [Malassezia psittaci]|uniref:Sister chromatid cohesion protein n=1 Tax=Malassezia psittaci TaxID=1821823 RepID=A0AAF0JDQ1_9BASI|nr:Sister chromatid cohesion protein 2 [Malassezia psittaci]
MVEGGADAFPISPPTRREVGRPFVPSSPDAESLDTLESDLPLRLRERTSASSSYLGKHEASDDLSSEATKIAKLSSSDTNELIMATSDAFDGQVDDFWDLDDAELYSGENLLLASEEPQQSVHKDRGTHRPISQLQALIDSFAVQEGSQPRKWSQDGSEDVLKKRALQELHSLLRLCTRKSDSLQATALNESDQESNLMELGVARLSCLTTLLEATIRNALCCASDNDSIAHCISASISGLLSAQCIISIYCSAQVVRNLFSEETMGLCIATIKLAIDKIVVPIMESQNNDSKSTDTNLVSLITDPSSHVFQESTAHFHLTCSTMASLDRVVVLSSVSMSDTLIIACVYLAIAPFYAQDNLVSLPNSSSVYCQGYALHPLRLCGLSILREIFAHYTEQRAWVLSELLASLLRLPDLRHRSREFRLANGKKIYTMTALLLQLIQAASADDPSKRERARAWLEGEQSVENPLAELPQAGVYTLSGATAAFLAQKASQAKLVKNSLDLSYASVVYALMEDLLSVFLLPDWPAAPLLLACFCKTFMGYVRDAKSSVDAKAIALDHIGTVAARIKQTQIEIQHSSECGSLLQSMTEICLDQDVDALHQREHAVYGVAKRLSKHKEAGTSGAIAFHLGQLGFEIMRAVERLRAKSDANPQGKEVINEMRRVYERIPLCESGSDINKLTVPQLVLSSDYFVDTTSLLALLLQGANAQALATRARALRGIGNIAAVDDTLLQDTSVRSVILSHITDASASVRETAVATIGAFMLTDKEARALHWSEVLDRILDANVAVRKRVLRLMCSFYNLEDDYAHKLELIIKTLRCVHDDDVGIQTMAINTLTDIWFPECNLSESHGNKAEPVAVVVQMLTDIGAKVKERPSPLYSFLHQLDSHVDGFFTRLGALVDQLLANLFVESPSTSALVLDHVCVVQMLVSTHPGVLTIRRAMQLLPYVSGAESTEDVAVMEQILYIYQSSLPYMPRTAKAFANALEQTLLPLISRCPLRPDSSALQALVACFCSVIEHHTHNQALIQRSFERCFDRLKSVANNADQKSASFNRAKFLLMRITALLCRYGGLELSVVHETLDVLIRLYEIPSYRLASLMALSPVLCVSPALFLDERVVEALNASFLDKILGERNLALRVLLDYLDLEANQAVSKTEAVVPSMQLDMLDELLGTTNQHADTGIASALVQRYASQVLKAAVDIDRSSAQRTAMELLQLAVLQGLIHPIQCTPVLVALETAEEYALRRRALSLHRHLATKHMSMLATQTRNPIHASFQFQRKRCKPHRPKGYRVEDEPVALLGDWYSIIREQRNGRHSFLRTLVRMMDISQPFQCSSQAVDLALYAAENLALLPYKVLDEPLDVLHELHLLYAGIGLQVLGQAERYLRRRGPSPLTDEEEDQVQTQQQIDNYDSSTEPTPTDNNPTPYDDQEQAQDSDLSQTLVSDDIQEPISDESVHLARSAVIVELAHSLMEHLKKLYRLTDSKYEKYATGGRAERATAAHRISTNAMDAVLSFECPRINSESQAVKFLEEWVDEAHDSALEMDA